MHSRHLILCLGGTLPMLAGATLALAALSPTAMAQANPYNTFTIYPDQFYLPPTTPSTSWASRLLLNTNPGEALQEIPGNLIGGIGDRGTTCTFRTAQVAHQDFNAATQETYQFLIRRADAAGAPDNSAAGLVMQSTPVMTPMGTGGLAWITTLTFTTDVPLPCTGTLFLGMRLGAAPNPNPNPTDGHYLHVAHYGTSGQRGDNPRTGAPGLGWVIDASGVRRDMTGQVIAIGIGQDTPMLAMGNNDPGSTRTPNMISFGAGGLYPLQSRDGLNWQVIDKQNPNGNAFLLIGAGMMQAPFTVPGIGGRPYLDITKQIVSAGTMPLDGTGYGMAALVPPGTIPPGLQTFSLTFQALTAGTGLQNVRFSNAWSVSF